MVFVFTFVVSLVFVFFIESYVKPKPVSFFRRSKVARLITSLLVLCILSLVFFVSQRLFFSFFSTVILLSVVLVINKAKFKTLREPLVFSDFFLYLQAIKHPRLYLPFLGFLPLFLGSLIIPSVIFSGFYFESSANLWGIYFFGVGVVFFLVCFALLISLSRKVKITACVNEDYKELGIFAALFCYATQAKKSQESSKSTILKCSPFTGIGEFSNINYTHKLADIVVVQSESFFDARLLTENVKSSVLTEYDKCLLESDWHGQLSVPAWGANTMRTEFAFLTGLNSKILGLSQFYPYQQLTNITVPSIVGELKSQGYRCICIHPNASSFFMRDVFFKKLGFDEFIDDDSFEGAHREGPYIADSEVSEKIKQVLNESKQPCFIFAITMENHGPLHLESLEENEWQQYYNDKPKSVLRDLSIYLRHLNNADEMIWDQLEFYKERKKDTVFAFYGDHVPAISHVFEALEYEDPRSNYFIWSTNHKLADNRLSNLSVESLGRAVLDVASNCKTEINSK